MTRIQNEPVLTVAGIVGAVMALLAMAVSLGWINLEPGQMSAIETALTMVLAIALPLVGGWIARGKVTPVSNPKMADGTPARLVKR